MTKDHQTETDDLVERLEDSKGWPNLGKAAATRILADAEVIKAAEALGKWAGNLLSREADPRTGGRVVLEADLLRLEESLAAFRRAQQVRAEKGGA